MNTLSKRFFWNITLLVIITALLPFLLYYINPGLVALTSTGTPGEIPYLEMPIFKQWVAVFGGFVIKPSYMMLSFILIIFLWRRNETDLKLLRWGLILFLAGEIFCFFNYAFFHETSAFMEHLHSYGMVLGFGFIFSALLESIDHRILKLSLQGDKCAALDLCAGCVKYKNVPCGLRRLFLFLIPAIGILSFIPLTIHPQQVSYNTTIWGTLYNYSHALIHQIYEIRYCPWVGIGFLAGAFLVLLLQKQSGLIASKRLLGFGSGFLSFGILRGIFLHLYLNDMVWFVFWEEATELLFISGIGILLWIFRIKLWQSTKTGHQPMG